MATGIHHVHIKAKDPRKTAKWWIDMFGAKPLDEREVRGALFVPVEIGGLTINISSPRPEEVGSMGAGDPTIHYGLKHVGLSVDDLDSQISKFEAQGLEVYERSGHMAFVEGPDDVRIELIQAAR